MKIDESTYVDRAENVILELKKELADKKNKKTPLGISSSQLYNILSLTVDIYNQVVNWKEEKLSEELRGRVDYLRVRCVYECGRENNEDVKKFVEKAEILEILKKIRTRNDYMLFTHYMEALVAYHKFYGGK